MRLRKNPAAVTLRAIFGHSRFSPRAPRTIQLKLENPYD